MTNISIITIGDELLIGQVIDTNSAWIAQEMNKAGFRIKRRVAVGDVWDEIWQALDEESAQADVVLITGGLGPTADDITKPLLCKYFGGQLVQNKAALDNVAYLFEKVFNRPVTERNIRQADVPDVCHPIQNKRGTAPGMIFNKNGKIFISMPGVPYEMQGMITDDVIPLLEKQFIPEAIIHRTLVTFGIGESSLADLIQDFEESLPPEIKLAYLPNYGMVRLRLSSRKNEKETAGAMVDQKFEALQLLVRKYLVAVDDEPMQHNVGKLLIERKKTLSTAESCTGGYIAHLITAQPGASAYYNGTIVSYSNNVKENVLQVSKENLDNFGAVSEQVVIDMAKGALKKMKTDYAIAVSGIMGPDGGTETKPVGTVWIAVADNSKQVAQKFHFRFNRQRNIELTAVNAFNLLRSFLLDEPAEA
jgi:nicotinamide-nucleotide amidase